MYTMRIWFKEIIGQIDGRITIKQIPMITCATEILSVVENNTQLKITEVTICKEEEGKEYD